MGWLSMTRSGMATFATPKAYLDNLSLIHI